MRLHELAGALTAAVGDDPEITALEYDSRRARPGCLFFCVSGFNVDGHEFAPAAVAAGAAALVVERPLELAVPQLIVESVRGAMGPLADRFYGHPSQRLRVVGVTGTNGKTTSAYLVRELFEGAGVRCGLLGTVTSIVGGVERDVVRTTPEAIDLQRELRAMVDGGDGASAVEVSSHALALGRAAGVRFAAAIFTNLTQDHLDFHADMEDYYLAKRLLFLPPDGEPPAERIVNVGDAYGRRLAGEIGSCTTVALERAADYVASELECDLTGCAFTLTADGVAHRLRLPMPGRFNVVNALGAIAAVHRLGVPLASLLATLERGVRVPGRFEPVDGGQPFAVLVDYAHTPDSLENVLAAARELATEAPSGRVICVFGAGGDRDRSKRPLMGEIAMRLADVAIVTSDNPRSEEPEQIIREIVAGAPAAANAQAITDRREAIERAVDLAAAGDVLIIAGKGHERGQEFAGGHKVPFDDVEVARAALTARRSAA